MKCIVRAAALLLVVIAPATQPAPAQTPPAAAANEPATPSWGPPNPQIDVVYVEPKNPAFQPLYGKLKARQVLEALQSFLAPLRLSRKLLVKIDQCGASRVHYRPGGPATICYEYIANLEEAAPDVKLQLGGQVFTRDDALVGSFVHVALHEVARAAFDILAIPVWGREEHAADRVSGFLMFQFGEKVAYRTLVGTSWFLSQSAVLRTVPPPGDFSYTRGLDGETLQRFYNAVCIALGGDEAKFAFLKKSLPEGRANNCRWEFLPHVDRDLLKKVQATDWLQSSDEK